MPVLTAYETFDNRNAKVATNRLREYTRSFNVIMSSRLDDGIAARLAPGVPIPWSPYVAANGLADLGSWCREVTVKQDVADPYLWRLTAHYSSVVERPDVNQVENPLLRPADISWDTVTLERPAFTDLDGVAILTEAKDRFDPPVMLEERRLQLTVTRNQATYDALGYAMYENAVNDDTFLGFLPGRVKVTSIKGQRRWENGVLYWQATFQFQIRVKFDDADVTLGDAEKSLRAWKVKVLHQGFHEMVAGKRVHATDPRGRPTPVPVLLDAAGAKIDPAVDQPYFLTFTLYPSLPFANLQLF